MEVTPAAVGAETWPPPKGEGPFDWWSGVHLGTGVGLGLLRLHPGLVLLLLVGYEGVEAGLRRWRPDGPGGLFERESWANIVWDVILGFAGYLLGLVLSVVVRRA